MSLSGERESKRKRDRDRKRKREREMESDRINGKSGPLVAQRACHKKRKCGYTQGSANIWAPTHAHTHTPSHSLADLTDRLKLIGQVLLGGPPGQHEVRNFCGYLWRDH